MQEDTLGIEFEALVKDGSSGKVELSAVGSIMQNQQLQKLRVVYKLLLCSVVSWGLVVLHFRGHL